MINFEIAMLIHQELLREAEKKRPDRQVALDAPASTKTPLQHLGAFLIAFGNRRKGDAVVQKLVHAQTNQPR